MAKNSTGRNKTIGEGKSWQQIVKMSGNEIRNLTDKELKQLTSRLNSAATKRLKRLAAKGSDSPTLTQWREHGQKRFTNKGLRDRKDIVKAFNRAKDLLTSRTSTQKGIKEWKSDITARLNRSFGVGGEGFTQEEWTKLMNGYEKILIEGYGEYSPSEVQNILRDIMKKNPMMTSEEVAKELMRRVGALDSEGRYAEYDDGFDSMNEDEEEDDYGFEKYWNV